MASSVYPEAAAAFRTNPQMKVGGRVIRIQIATCLF